MAKSGRACDFRCPTDTYATPSFRLLLTRRARTTRPSNPHNRAPASASLRCVLGRGLAHGAHGLGLGLGYGGMVAPQMMMPMPVPMLHHPYAITTMER